MPWNSDVSASEIADLRSELADLRQINLRRSDREHLSIAVNLTMTLALIAVEALARSSMPMAGVLALEILDWLDDPAAAEAAFGIRHRGGVSKARSEAIAFRNARLLDLKRAHAVWSILPPGPAAKAMRSNFDRYETTRWLRDRHHSTPPTIEPARTWWRILRGDVPMPGVDRLRQIIAREIQ